MLVADQSVVVALPAVVVVLMLCLPGFPVPLNHGMVAGNLTMFMRYYPVVVFGIVGFYGFTAP